MAPWHGKRFSPRLPHAAKDVNVLVKNTTTKQAWALSRALLAQMTKTGHLRHQAKRIPVGDAGLLDEYLFPRSAPRRSWLST